MEKIVILQGIELNTFLANIDAIVDKRLTEKMELLIPSKKVTYLSRKEICQILKISLVTLSAWTKEGKIISYRIGKRVLYKSDEVENVLIRRKFR